MSIYKDLYLRYMDGNEIKYTDLDDDAVRVSYNGEHIPTITVMCFFDEDSDGNGQVTLRSWEICRVPADKRKEANEACNEANSKFRWAKFYIDEDNDLCAQIDAMLDEDSCARICDRLIERLVSIVDEAYPAIMKVLWG